MSTSWQSPFRRGLPVGAAAIPPAAALDRAGHPVDVLDVPPEQAQVLLLADAGFSPCRRLLDDLAHEGWHHPVPLVVVLTPSVGPADPTGEDVRRAGVDVLRETDDAAVAEALGCNVFPTVFGMVGTTVMTSPTVPASLDHLVEVADGVRRLAS